MKKLVTGETDKVCEQYQYNSNGETTVQYIADSFEDCWRKTYKYPLIGNEITVEVYDYFKPDRRIGTEKYTPDEQGKIKELVRYNADGQQIERIERTFVEVNCLV